VTTPAPAPAPIAVADAVASRDQPAEDRRDWIARVGRL